MNDIKGYMPLELLPALIAGKALVFVIFLINNILLILA